MEINNLHLLEDTIGDMIFFYEVARFQQEGKDMLTTPTLVLFNPSFEKISNIPGYYPKETLLNKLQNIIK